jgi:predicted RecB family nuclease
MRELDGTLMLSASDLTRFMGCAHATTLDLARLRGLGPEPRADSEEAELLQQQGMAHEAAFLKKLKAEGRQVHEIRSKDLREACAETREAMGRGVDVIYQGALAQDQWGGWADFILRVDRPSALGGCSYEVVDTKLKRSVDPKHILQLVLYSDLVAEIQGAAPEFAYLALGDGWLESLRLTHYAYYARAVRDRLEAFVAEPAQTRPVPCADCALCRWADHCESTWRAEDSLFTVANITRGQVKKLESVGIRRRAELASSDGDVRGMARPKLDLLRTQARLQHERAESTGPGFVLRPSEPGKGFDLLPEPKLGDLFYDIEGDPHHPGGLEYLHGVWDGERYTAFWSHDHAEEKQAVVALLNFFEAHLARHPDARIYHYAPYEITALRRLTMKYGVCESMLDRFLRERRFVDLYAVVRSGMVCSEPDYSIKSLEVFYDLSRDGAVRDGGASVVAYHRWCETRDQKILDELASYNRVDCVSTGMLRGWLLKVRPPGPWPVLAASASGDEAGSDPAIELRSMLARSGLTEERQEMLFNLGCFHKREEKPAWWAVFDSLGKDDDVLIDDLSALAGLSAISGLREVNRSVTRDYSFPQQETRLKGGDLASVFDDGRAVQVTITAFDRSRQVLTLKVGAAKAHLLSDRLTLHPATPLKTKAIANALMDVVDDQCRPEGQRRYGAVDDMLSMSLPRLKGRTGEIVPAPASVGAIVAAIEAMDATTLPVQGPPGTGKTYVAARAIVSLASAGHRVGVSSNSHAAIRNLLTACVDAMRETGMADKALDIVHKTDNRGGEYPTDSPVRAETDNASAAKGRNIVGGTVFFFAREENTQQFDWLFVDEAGQVSLANMLAIGRASRNLVLVGDPQQLPQVIQGAHPSPADLSCLQWMLGSKATIPPERGVFLSETRRMHPELNRYVSEQFYEGRLQSHPDTVNQAILGTRFPESGAHWVSVEHEGNAQMAEEEVDAIHRACRELLHGRWRDRDGTERAMREADIIVVAPYNIQVNRLRERLPAGIAVGTVDKFQGQEAPVCLVSMTASSADDSPRGLEFLLSLNRSNVAISRAKALSLVFGSPRLRMSRCGSPDDMYRVNAICRLPMIAGASA